MDNLIVFINILMLCFITSVTSMSTPLANLDLSGSTKQPCSALFIDFDTVDFELGQDEAGHDIWTCVMGNTDANLFFVLAHQDGDSYHFGRRFPYTQGRYVR